MPFSKEPKSRQPKEQLVLNERIQAIADEYEALGYKYVITPVEKEELIFEKYKKKFASTYKYDIQHIFRIKHNKEEFITYRIIEEVIDNNGLVHDCSRAVGYHSSPIGRVVKDQLGDVTSSTIQGHRLVYEIPFDRAFLRKLIEGSRSTISDLCVGIGSNYPPDIINGNPQKIWNEEEFVKHEFDDLFGASVAGMSRTGYGGVDEFIDYRKSGKIMDIRRKQVEESENQIKRSAQLRQQQQQAQAQQQ